ncbi:MAG: glutathione S-transferase N-terminal domain-containing protein [Burkholderiaceae bacterium]
MTAPAPPQGANAPAYTLYADWRSAASFRVRVALAMKGLQAEERRIDLGAGEQHGPAYRALSPLGGIPTLVPAGHAPITQSMAILEFLEEAHPSPALLPKDRHGRARVRSLAGMIAADTHPLITPASAITWPRPRPSTTRPGVPGRPTGLAPGCARSSSAWPAKPTPARFAMATP